MSARAPARIVCVGCSIIVVAACSCRVAPTSDVDAQGGSSGATTSFGGRASQGGVSEYAGSASVTFARMRRVQGAAHD